VVFRPFFKAPVYSGGVLAEIRHWADLARENPQRRIAFLHRISDIGQAVADPSVRDAAVLTFEKLVAERLGTDLEAAKRAILALNNRTIDMLDTGAETGEERRVTKAAIEAARLEVPRRLLWRLLTLFGVQIVSVPLAQVGLWVVRDDVPWDAILPAVSEFLSGSNIEDTAFESALSFLPSDLVPEVTR
jgi:hypothetical protein